MILTELLRGEISTSTLYPDSFIDQLGMATNNNNNNLSSTTSGASNIENLLFYKERIQHLNIPRSTYESYISYIKATKPGLFQVLTNHALFTLNSSTNKSSMLSKKKYFQKSKKKDIVKKEKSKFLKSAMKDTSTITSTSKTNTSTSATFGVSSSRTADDIIIQSLDSITTEDINTNPELNNTTTTPSATTATATTEAIDNTNHRVDLGVAVAKAITENTLSAYLLVISLLLHTYKDDNSKKTTATTNSPTATSTADMITLPMINILSTYFQSPNIIPATTTATSTNKTKKSSITNKYNSNNDDNNSDADEIDSLSMILKRHENMFMSSSTTATAANRSTTSNKCGPYSANLSQYIDKLKNKLSNKLNSTTTTNAEGTTSIMNITHPTPTPNTATNTTTRMGASESDSDTCGGSSVVHNEEDGDGDDNDDGNYSEDNEDNEEDDEEMSEDELLAQALALSMTKHQKQASKSNSTTNFTTTTTTASVPRNKDSTESLPQLVNISTATGQNNNNNEKNNKLKTGNNTEILLNTTNETNQESSVTPIIQLLSTFGIFCQTETWPLASVIDFTSDYFAALHIRQVIIILLAYLGVAADNILGFDSVPIQNTFFTLNRHQFSPSSATSTNNTNTSTNSNNSSNMGNMKNTTTNANNNNNSTNNTEKVQSNQTSPSFVPEKSVFLLLEQILDFLMIELKNHNKIYPTTNNNNNSTDMDINIQVAEWKFHQYYLVWSITMILKILNAELISVNTNRISLYTVGLGRTQSYNTTNSNLMSLSGYHSQSDSESYPASNMTPTNRLSSVNPRLMLVQRLQMLIADAVCLENSFILGDHYNIINTALAYIPAPTINSATAPTTTIPTTSVDNTTSSVAVLLHNPAYYHHELRIRAMDVAITSIIILSAQPSDRDNTLLKLLEIAPKMAPNGYVQDCFLTMQNRYFDDKNVTTCLDLLSNSNNTSYRSNSSSNKTNVATATTTSITNTSSSSLYTYLLLQKLCDSTLFFEYTWNKTSSQSPYSNYDIIPYNNITSSSSTTTSTPLGLPSINTNSTNNNMRSTRTDAQKQNRQLIVLKLLTRLNEPELQSATLFLDSTTTTATTSNSTTTTTTNTSNAMINQDMNTLGLADTDYIYYWGEYTLLRSIQQVLVRQYLDYCSHGSALSPSLTFIPDKSHTTVTLSDDRAMASYKSWGKSWITVLAGYTNSYSTNLTPNMNIPTTTSTSSNTSGNVTPRDEYGISSMSGIHEWSVKIFNCDRGNIFVGLVTTEANTDTYIGGDKYGWGIIGTKSLWHNRSKVVSDFGPGFASNSVINLRYNSDIGSLYIYSAKTQEWLLAYENLPSVILFPAVSMHHREDKVGISLNTINTEKTPNSNQISGLFDNNSSFLQIRESQLKLIQFAQILFQHVDKLLIQAEELILLSSSSNSDTNQHINITKILNILSHPFIGVFIPTLLAPVLNDKIDINISGLFIMQTLPFIVIIAKRLSKIYDLLNSHHFAFSDTSLLLNHIPTPRNSCPTPSRNSPTPSNISLVGNKHGLKGKWIFKSQSNVILDYIVIFHDSLHPHTTTTNTNNNNTNNNTDSNAMNNSQDEDNNNNNNDNSEDDEDLNIITKECNGLEILSILGQGNIIIPSTPTAALNTSNATSTATTTAATATQVNIQGSQIGTKIKFIETWDKGNSYIVTGYLSLCGCYFVGTYKDTKTNKLGNITGYKEPLTALSELTILSPSITTTSTTSTTSTTTSLVYEKITENIKGVLHNTALLSSLVCGKFASQLIIGIDPSYLRQLHASNTATTTNRDKMMNFDETNKTSNNEGDEDEDPAVASTSMILDSDSESTVAVITTDPLLHNLSAVNDDISPTENDNNNNKNNNMENDENTYVTTNLSDTNTTTDHENLIEWIQSELLIGGLPYTPELLTSLTEELSVFLSNKPHLNSTSTATPSTSTSMDNSPSQEDMLSDNVYINEDQYGFSSSNNNNNTSSDNNTADNTTTTNINSKVNRVLGAAAEAMDPLFGYNNIVPWWLIKVFPQLKSYLQPYYHHNILKSLPAYHQTSYDESAKMDISAESSKNTILNPKMAKKDIRISMDGKLTSYFENTSTTRYIDYLLAMDINMVEIGSKLDEYILHHTGLISMRKVGGEALQETRRIILACLIYHSGCDKLCFNECQALTHENVTQRKLFTSRPPSVLKDIWRAVQRVIDHIIKQKQSSGM